MQLLNTFRKFWWKFFLLSNVTYLCYWSKKYPFHDSKATCTCKKNPTKNIYFLVMWPLIWSNSTPRRQAVVGHPGNDNLKTPVSEPCVATTTWLLQQQQQVSQGSEKRMCSEPEVHSAYWSLQNKLARTFQQLTLRTSFAIWLTLAMS